MKIRIKTVSIEYKACSKCKKELPSTEFYKNRSMKDGLAHYCKECNREAKREHYKVHRDHYLEYNHKWRKENIEHSLEYGRERNAEQRESMTEYKRKYRLENTTKYRAHMAVTNAIKRLDLPPAHGLVCESCQEAQAQEYHHHNGYAPKHILDVVALCTTCHGEEHRIDV